MAGYLLNLVLSSGKESSWFEDAIDCIQHFWRKDFLFNDSEGRSKLHDCIRYASGTTDEKKTLQEMYDTVIDRFLGIGEMSLGWLQTCMVMIDRRPLIVSPGHVQDQAAYKDRFNQVCWSCLIGDERLNVRKGVIIVGNCLESNGLLASYEIP
jgi:hypothetical protein